MTAPWTNPRTNGSSNEVVELSRGVSVNLNPSQVAEDFIENFDREPGATAKGPYAFKEQYATEEGIPQAGVSVGAGVGYAEAHASILSADAQGPNARAGASISALSGVSATAGAEVASASVKAGPVRANIGLAVPETGVSIGPLGAEVKVLGNGFKIGPETIYSQVSCSIL